MKVLKWLGIISISLPLFLLVFIHIAACWFRMPDHKIDKFFAKAEVNYKIQRDDVGEISLRWVEAGNLSADKIIFFLHGAPGGFHDFSAFMKDSLLTKRYRLISMDRPGYGYSGYGEAEPSIIRQADAVQHVLSHYQLSELILVGYSYGGPVAAASAARYPQKVKALLLLAPVIAPEGEKLFWFNSLINTWLVRRLIPRIIVVANEEKLHHTTALREMAGTWKNIDAPVYHLHCKDDWIAPFADNTNWTKLMIPEEELTLITWQGDSHFLPGQIKNRVDSVFSLIFSRN